eukprot:scaffold51106_cov69-Phaeocystis_antarctica.AAC.2
MSRQRSSATRHLADLVAARGRAAEALHDARRAWECEAGRRHRHLSCAGWYVLCVYTTHTHAACAPRVHRVCTACAPRVHRVCTACAPRVHPVCAPRVLPVCAPRVHRAYTACMHAHGAALPHLADVSAWPLVAGHVVPLSSGPHLDALRPLAVGHARRPVGVSPGRTVAPRPLRTEADGA